ncbi:hypothetical protein D3C86_1069250 [compost metagenome]
MPPYWTDLQSVVVNQPTEVAQLTHTMVVAFTMRSEKSSLKTYGLKTTMLIIVGAESSIVEQLPLATLSLKIIL